MAEQIERKEAQVVAILNDTTLARIGTAGGSQPHVVPVWFLWDGESIWISAFSSTRKVKDLRKNPRLAVLIEAREPQDGRVQAVLFEGVAELIESPRALVEEMSAKIYERYLGPQGVQAADPQSWIYDPENTLVKLTPRKKFIW